MGLLPLAPEASASTNFATSALSRFGLDLPGRKVGTLRSARVLVNAAQGDMSKGNAESVSFQFSI